MYILRIYLIASKESILNCVYNRGEANLWKMKCLWLLSENYLGLLFSLEIFFLWQFYFQLISFRSPTPVDDCIY